MENASFPTPAKVVSDQLAAYNAKNLPWLLSLYAADAELYEHPSTLLANGTEALRQRFSVRFSEPNLHAVLLQRMVQGSTVIDHERITRNFPEGLGTLDMIMVYDVRKGCIQKAWTLVGEKRLSEV